jgi:hypothetical protein
LPAQPAARPNTKRGCNAAVPPVQNITPKLTPHQRREAIARRDAGEALMDTKSTSAATAAQQ